MISKNRKKIIYTVAALSIAMILANILQAGTFSFAPMIAEDFSPDNLDEEIIHSPDTVMTNDVESPIHIDDNAENNWEWAKNQGLCSGSGNYNDPYVIKDLTIDAGGSGSGILIENSDEYFSIDNCIVYNSGTYYMDAGIKLSNTRSGEIINNDCSNNNAGIYLEDNSNNNDISGNTANNNNWYGIYLEDSKYNTISGNTANNNDYYGIALQRSNENTLRNNNIGENFMGIILSSSSVNTVKENTFSDNSYGIILTGLSGGPSSDNTIYLNYFYRSLKDHAGYLYRRGSGNSWDDGSIGNYWDDYGGIDDNDDGIGDDPYEICNPIPEEDRFPIWDDGPAHDGSPIYIYGNSDWEWASTQQWCSGSGTEEDPYVIKDLVIWAYEEYCILIEESDVYFRIENCEVSAYGDAEDYVAGIILAGVKNGEIKNCKSYWNDGDYYEFVSAYGIYLINSDDNIISGNYVYENFGWITYGIYLKNDCDNNTISENTAYDNDYGIKLEDYCDDNTISGNTAYDNGYGIYLEGSTDNIISQNDVSDNGVGIYLWYSADNTILENTVISSAYTGIYLSSSSDNQIDDNEASYSGGCGIFISYYSDWNWGGGNYLHDNEWLPLYDDGSYNSVSYYE